MHRRLWSAVALAALAGPLAFAAPARAAVTAVAKVDFAPAGTAAPAGYTIDTGAAFDATRGSGWVRQDNHLPLDLTPNTRNRARAGIDARLNTIIHA